MTTEITTLEKSGYVVLQFECNLADEEGNPSRKEPFLVLSERIKYKKNYSFRASLLRIPSSTSGPKNLLFLMATNLNKMGLKAVCVIAFSSENETGKKKMDFINNKNEDGTDDGDVQFFTSSLPDDVISTITFTVHLIGSGDSFQVRQMDGLLSQQLWLSATNQAGTDYNLITQDGKSFPVHKWILAARSPVFAALLSETEDKQNDHHYLNCTDNELSQFIKFIYIGELCGLISRELMQLAVTYQVESLEKLCNQAVPKEFSIECNKKAAAFAAKYFDSGSPLLRPTEKKKDSDFEIDHEETVSILKCKWNVSHWTKQIKSRRGEVIKCVAISKTFKNKDIGKFRTVLEMTHCEEENRPIYLTFQNFWYRHHNINFNIAEVNYVIHPANTSRQYLYYLRQSPIKMLEQEIRNDNYRKVFSVRSLVKASLSWPFTVIFHVKLQSKVENFTNQLLDSSGSQQLWDAAVNKKMTDVEFLVGEEAFGAHRSLLSARSPVFAGMFASGMKEAETGQVRIDDTDPKIFQCFLKFLYTGMYEPSPMDSDLLTVADKYQVETLMELCRPIPDPEEPFLFSLLDLGLGTSASNAEELLQFSSFHNFNPFSK